MHLFVCFNIIKMIEYNYQGGSYMKDDIVYESELTVSDDELSNAEINILRNYGYLFLTSAVVGFGSIFLTDVNANLIALPFSVGIAGGTMLYASDKAKEGKRLVKEKYENRKK